MGIISMNDCFDVDDDTKHNWQLIGAFLTYFSELEAATNEFIITAFKLDEKQGPIVASLIDLSRKVSLIEAIIEAQQLEDTVKQNAHDLLNSVRRINDSRVILAHATLKSGSSPLKLLWSKPKGKKKKDSSEEWPEEKFKEHCEEMIKLSEKMETLRQQLGPTLTITVPDIVHHLSVSAFATRPVASTEPVLLSTGGKASAR